jgi:hypothetical protein
MVAPGATIVLTGVGILTFVIAIKRLIAWFARERPGARPLED